MNNYYAHGKFFDDKEEFINFCKNWPGMPFDLDEFKRQMQIRIREAELNNEVRGGNLTNREAYQILRIATDWAMDAYRIEDVDSNTGK